MKNSSPYAFTELKAFTNDMPSLDYEQCLIQYDLPDVVTVVAEVFKNFSSV